MDIRGIIGCVLFTIYVNKQVLAEVCSTDMPLPRPPAFPDIMGSFIKTLENNRDIFNLHKTLTEDFTHHEVCNCTAAIVENWAEFNTKCEPEELTCPEPTTTTEEPTTTTTEEPTTVATTTTPTTTKRTVIISSATRPRTSRKTTTSPTTSTTTTTLKTNPPTTTTTTTTTSSTTPTTTTSTEKSTKATKDVSAVVPTNPAPVTGNEKDTTVRNIIIASVCGGSLALIIVTVTLCYVGKCPTPTTSHMKQKFARQRSDCQPLPENEGFGSVPHTPVGKQDSIGGYSNQGFRWQDGDGSTPQPTDNKQVLLLEEDFHYSTLKAVDHPHALMRSGFGETSTDKTLTKTKSKKKHRRGSSKKAKSTDANHNPKNSVGKNSTHSTGSAQDKLSLKSAGSMKSKGSIKKHNPSLPLPATVVGEQPQVSPDELIDGKNEHLFAYTPPPKANGMSVSKPSIAGSQMVNPPSLPGSQVINTSLQGSEIILAPPSEFMGSTDLARTAVLNTANRPQRQNSHSSSSSAEKKSTSTDEVSISMEDMSGKVYTVDGDTNHQNDSMANEDDVTTTPKPKSFLWGSPKKSSPDIIPKNGGVGKTVM